MFLEQFVLQLLYLKLSTIRKSEWPQTAYLNESTSQVICYLNMLGVDAVESRTMWQTSWKGEYGEHTRQRNAITAKHKMQLSIWPSRQTGVSFS